MSSPRAGNRLWKVRLITLFIALALAVTWYYHVKRYASGVPGNYTNYWCFSAMSKSNYHMEGLGVWRPRIAGLWIAGQLLDSVVTNGLIDVPAFKAEQLVLMSVKDPNSPTPHGTFAYVTDYERVFGLYHACWLFLFFVVLVVFLENPLLIMLGTLAGMFYTLTPAAVYYAYAWDMPSMLFFTLGYCLWRRKLYYWMLAVIFVGCLFKETTAVIAILFFFTGLSWQKRIGLFIGAGVMAFVQKVVIMETMYNVATVHTQDFTLWANIKEVFSLKWNHFIFVNAGTLFIAVVLPARTMMQWGTKALIIIFWACQAWAGSFSEFRIMLEVLPISLICIAEYINPLSKLEPVTAVTNPLKPQKAAKR